MSIHSVIQERRKALGLTQEQVADYLGVTTPAVNKWEKGGSCPDISLLAPLARLLKIDLNTLLGFNEDITKQELILFCKEIHETVLDKGFEVGFSLAQEKIREYPSSDTLLHNLALQLQGLLATAGLAEEKTTAYLDQIRTWCERLTQSSEAVIRNSACFMLSSRAIADGQFEKAQEYLDQMPNRNDTPDKRMLQATIYLNQNRAEEAAELMERTLLTSVNDMQMVLYKLIDANAAIGDHETAAYVADRVSGLAELFDLNRYNMIIGPFQVAVAKKDIPQTVVLLREIFKALTGTWDIHASPLYRRIQTNNAGTTLENMVRPLIQGLKQAPEYAYLQNDQDFQALLSEYTSQIEFKA